MHFKKISAGLIAAIAITITTAGCSSHKYAEQARSYTEAVTHELVALGACATTDECQRNQMVLWEGGGWQVGPFKWGGVDIEVYRVADSGVAEALIERLRQIHSAHPEVAVSITIQSNAHIDNLHPGTRAVVKEAKWAGVDGGTKQRVRGPSAS